MFERPELIDLRTRKEALLRISEINRCVLRLETARCHQVAGWVDTGVAGARTAATILSVFSLVASLRRRRSRPSKRFLPKLAAGITLARSATKIWNLWKQKVRTAEAPGK